MGLTGKIALVTGGSRGIGRAVAIALAREGCDVTISYTSNEEAAQATVAAIEAAGGKGSARRFDVADADACKEAVDAIVKDKGGLHILVNNAGVSLDGLLMRYKDEDLDRIFRTNVFGAFYLTRAASRAMMKQRWGRIIMMGSVVGDMGNTGQTAYAGTKAALEGMAKSVARELASRNITANVITPGFIDTDMTKALPEAARTALLEQIPLGAMGTSDDIADAVVYLASERAKYVTGQVLGVNGGLYM
ncbi:3-oxoacyl-[acyl-carrier-protein] reductase [Myxococcota bacterium]|nr:3-oxoacyl-[acyl-carrier-protein] reductase [Myxococcota bacterium]